MIKVLNTTYLNLDNKNLGKKITKQFSAFNNQEHPSTKITHPYITSLACLYEIMGR